MLKFRTLLVDDEPLICDELTCALSIYPDIEIIGIVHTAEAALKIMLKQSLDLVFLDIQMPGMNGLELAAKINRKSRLPLIVFVTAFSDFAVQAFAVDALDYLLKPFDERDVERVLRKIRLHQKQPTPINNILHNICVMNGDYLTVVNENHIQMIQANDRQVFLRTVDGSIYIVRHRLNELEKVLDSKIFYRCHRNYIVNINEVAHLTPWFNHGYLLIMKDPAIKVPVGRVFAPKIKEYLLI